MEDGYLYSTAISAIDSDVEFTKASHEGCYMRRLWALAILFLHASARRCQASSCRLRASLSVTACNTLSWLAGWFRAGGELAEAYARARRVA